MKIHIPPVLTSQLFNSNKRQILDWFKLKALADVNMNITQN